MKHIGPSPVREHIRLEELQRWRQAGVIVSDERRRRPFWFDGRFLDARALNAEQDYLLARLADYGRAAGFGVVHGLGVQWQARGARSVTIGAGQGLTPSGAQVLLDEPLTVDLAAVAETRRLDARFGLAGEPAAPPYNRSGLYVLALRPVEYTADPITTYPTRTEGPRGSRDGSLVEATAVTLIPYPDAGAGTELADRRSAVAREIFLEESLKAQPEDVLPLAMLALDRGVIRWLDVFMVRREIAQRERRVWGLGVAPRALRAAHLRQYDDQLQDLLAQRGGDARLLASEHFGVLPPAGPMPASAIDAEDFTQSFFPAGMDVELSLVPEDELPALIDDALLLPPIDLETDAEAQAADAVLVLMPVSRSQFRDLARELPSLSRVLTPLQPEMPARRRPVRTLQGLMARRPRLPVDAGAESAWRNLLAGQERLWFVRRRNLNAKAEVAATAVTVISDEKAIDKLVDERLATLNQKTLFKTLSARATRPALAEVTRLLASPRLLEDSGVLTKAVINELAGLDEIDTGTVREVETRFADPRLGEGLARLAAVEPAFAGEARLLDNLARSGKLVELDRLVRALPEAELKKVAASLAESARGSGEAVPKRIAKMVEEMAAEVGLSGPTPTAVLRVNRPLGTARIAGDE